MVIINWCLWDFLWKKFGKSLDTAKTTKCENLAVRAHAKSQRTMKKSRSEYFTSILAMLNQELIARRQAEYLYTAALIGAQGALVWGVTAIPNKTLWPIEIAVLGAFFLGLFVAVKIFVEHLRYTELKEAQEICLQKLSEGYDLVLCTDEKIPELLKFLIKDKNESSAGNGYLLSLAIVASSTLFSMLFSFSIGVVSLQETFCNLSFVRVVNAFIVFLMVCTFVFILVFIIRYSLKSKDKELWVLCFCITIIISLLISICFYCNDRELFGCIKSEFQIEGDNECSPNSESCPRNFCNRSDIPPTPPPSMAYHIDCWFSDPKIVGECVNDCQILESYLPPTCWK